MSVRRLLATATILTALAAPAAPLEAPVSSGPAVSPAQLGPATGPVATLPAARVEAIEVVVTNEMARLGVPGLSLAIAHGGGLVFANGYGFADIENFVSAKADTAYRLASVSKPMTAVVVLQLAEQEALDLDAPARESCPAFPEKRWPVTARQLLSHRGGVRHYRDDEQPMTKRYTALSEGLGLFKDDPLEFEPGTAYQYTTYGYTLLGCIIEGVRGEPFANVLHTAVFEPAGMTRTRADDVRDLIPNRARGYVRDEQGTLVNAALADMSYKVPGGGLVGTAPDVARFGWALLSGRLLGEESLRNMLTQVAPGQDGGDGYGLGMSVAGSNGRPEAWHLGGQEGASSVLYLRGAEGPVVAILTNLEGVPPALLTLAQRIADLVVADPGTRPQPPRDDSSGLWPARDTSSDPLDVFLPLVGLRSARSASGQGVLCDPAHINRGTHLAKLGSEEAERQIMTPRLANKYLGIALLGGLVGAAVGLLVAPAPGTQTRRKVVRRSSVEDQELLLRRAEMAAEFPEEELDLLASA